MLKLSDTGSESGICSMDIKEVTFDPPLYEDFSSKSFLSLVCFAEFCREHDE